MHCEKIKIMKMVIYYRRSCGNKKVNKTPTVLLNFNMFCLRSALNIQLASSSIIFFFAFASINLHTSLSIACDNQNYFKSRAKPKNDGVGEEEGAGEESRMVRMTYSARSRLISFFSSFWSFFLFYVSLFSGVLLSLQSAWLALSWIIRASIICDLHGVVWTKL